MTLIALSAASSVLSAQEGNELPSGLRTKVEAAAQVCAEFNDGKFAIEAGAIARTDLDGDLKADWVLNEHYFACSSAASLYGTTGGTLSHFMVGDHISSILNHGWEMHTLGRKRVLLVDVHGTQCEAYGYTPCVTASVWDSEANTWRSASARWED